MKVLIADDDKVTRRLLRKYVEDAGHHVVEASDGMRARTVLEDNSDISLLITDVLMPGIDGRELVTGLRRDKRFEKLQILVMSATVGVGEIRRLLELGASRFLAKPVNLGQLGQELDAMLPPSHSMATGAVGPEAASATRVVSAPLSSG